MMLKSHSEGEMKLSLEVNGWRELGGRGDGKGKQGIRCRESRGEGEESLWEGVM